MGITGKPIGSGWASDVYELGEGRVLRRDREGYGQAFGDGRIDPRGAGETLAEVEVLGEAEVLVRSFMGWARGVGPAKARCRPR